MFDYESSPIFMIHWINQSEALVHDMFWNQQVEISQNHVMIIIKCKHKCYEDIMLNIIALPTILSIFSQINPR